ncbi:MAG: flagellar basal-body MS-ring/collar protein FliF [Betaproteobacteria bacterium]
MATNTNPAAPPASQVSRLIDAFGRLATQQKLTLLVAVAALVAVIVAGVLWAKQADYKVLFSNLSEKDGGAIVAALEQQNIPHQFSESNGAILVPSNRVHEVRLKLAQQGLPRGGAIGFELMDNPKFGLSQFAEQVNYQRALEGELARTIQSVGAIQAARVHLAIPKPSVFVREEQKPTASVLLTLYPGRVLDAGQIAGITHLVAASVPQLPIGNVNVIDQNGTLLSQLKSSLTEAGLDPAQIKYVRELEDSTIKRIDEILKPILGPENYKVQVAADVDFSQTEQTAESFKPNNVPGSTSIRSQQSTETANVNAGAGGVPGALTNQPPAPATAPLTVPATGTVAGQPTTTLRPGEGRIEAAGVTAPLNAAGQPVSTTKNSTINYEVDKTIRHTKQAMGTIRRLSAAVVVNHRREPGKDAKTPGKPLADAEMKQINDLVREAMGFNKERGDTLSIANSAFTASEKLDSGIPIWKDPGMLSLIKEVAIWIGMALIALYIWRRIIQPLVQSIVASSRLSAQEAAASARMADIYDEESPATQAVMNNYTAKMQRAKDVAQQDPKAVANIIKDWISPNAG